MTIVSSTILVGESVHISGKCIVKVLKGEQRERPCVGDGIDIKAVKFLNYVKHSLRCVDSIGNPSHPTPYVKTRSSGVFTGLHRANDYWIDGCHGRLQRSDGTT
jgi:hypothetical protein